ncbi:hypothetical protein M514_23685 [Trichuris suis]|uniref:Uncharacterized protein n=1 Tax=Trichuris suis TaxID=68888 RepID=A0A085N3Q8_9BILA|nr:hypothetical protein M514_23685 [Trichuris suis]
MRQTGANEGGTVMYRVFTHTSMPRAENKAERGGPSTGPPPSIPAFPTKFSGGQGIGSVELRGDDVLRASSPLSTADDGTRAVPKRTTHSKTGQSRESKINYDIIELLFLALVFLFEVIIK